MLVQVVVIPVDVVLDIEILEQCGFGLDSFLDMLVFLDLAVLAKMKTAPIPIHIVVRVIIRSIHTGVIVYGLPLVVDVEEQELPRLLESPLKPVMVSHIVFKPEFYFVRILITFLTHISS